MAYIAGEAKQVTMLPETLVEFIAEDHLCRVIEAFVNRLDGEARFSAQRAGGDGTPGL